MNLKKVLSWILTLSLAATLTACSGTSGTTGSDSSQEQSKTNDPDTSSASIQEDGPMTPYAETIVANFGMDYDPNGTDVARLAEAGEPYTDNRWTQLFEEKLNVKTNYEVITTWDQYNQQIKLLMSSNELPDYFKINNWSDFQQMAAAGALTDMTDIYEKYASPLLRSIIEKETDMVYLPVTYEGRMYGIPRVFPSTNGYNHLWIRRDWLKNLNLDVPETMDDLLNIARAFKNDDPDGDGQDNTLGMRLDETYLSNNKAIFWAFGAYPGIWLTKDDGSIDFGTIRPEMKAGLSFLKTMIDEGFVNPEFATTDRETSIEEIVSGKCGMYFAPHWETPKLSAEADSNADWIATPLPTEKAGDKIQIPLTMGGQDGAYVCTSSCEHPEALVKMLNVYVEALFGETGDFNKYFAMEGVAPIWSSSPVSTLDTAIDVDAHRQWKEAAKTGNYDDMVGSGKGFYEYDRDGLIEYGMMFGPEDSCFAFVDATYPDQVFPNAYFGAATPTQVERGSTLDEHINTSLAAILSGQAELDSEFDKMASDWRSMGGDQIISEITEVLSEFAESRK